MRGVGVNHHLRKFRIIWNYQERKPKISKQMSIFSHTIRQQLSHWN